MATRSIVPRADGEGGIGTAAKKWALGWINALVVVTVNALTVTAQSVGFTITGGTTPKTLTVTGDTTLSGTPIDTIVRSARTSNTILAAADQGTLIDIISGTFTQTFTDAATLGSGWYCYYRVSGTGDVTLDPNSAETIDGLATFVMYPGECRLIQCTGTAFFSVVLSPFYRAFIATGTFTKPPGYAYFGGLAWSAGASGQRTNNAAVLSVGGAGGGCSDFCIPSSVMSASTTITIGAGGVAVTGVANGNVGGSTSVGSHIVVFGTPLWNFGGYAYGGNSTKPVGYEGSQPTVAATSGVWGGGTASSDATTGNPIPDAFYGGGPGGSVDASGNLRLRGGSKLGGAGGAAVIAAAGGVAGTAPGGGGGATQTGTASGAGARGEVRIWGIV